MPIYEYQCEECKHRLEAMQKINDAPLTECPVCGMPGLRKLVSAAAFHLKGSGWYATDFKDKPKPKTEEKKTEAASGKKKDKAESTKTETPAKKHDKKEIASSTSD